MKVGERIRLRRKETGMSADQLADVIGVSRSTIFRYENGAIEKMPTSVLEPIAEALNTTPAYLMGWDDDPIDYDSLDDFYVPDEYRKLGMSNKEYYKFKETELKDIAKESHNKLTATLSTHEEDVIMAYRSHPEMQPAVDKILGVKEATPSYLAPIAAHNDNADDEEQIRLMNKDIERIKGMRKK